MTVIIRPARAGEAAALTALKHRTFRETFVEGGFAIPYPPADLARFEAAAYAPEVVAAELADPALGSWLAAEDDALLGYAMIGPCRLPHPAVGAGDGELRQLYLLDAAQGRGLGHLLLDAALAGLAVMFPGPQWLGVWSGNHRAQAIYRARGFAHVGNYDFQVGDWRDEEFIFRRERPDDIARSSP